jgi:hypothetical protein
MHRMLRIGRPAVQADVSRETSALLFRLASAMMSGAQTLQMTKPEQIRAAAMWLDMICNRRRRDLACALTHAAQRLLAQLHPGAPSPALCAVPSTHLLTRSR